HGKVPWIVRAIWEEHTGWFRYESTTELYDVPPAAIWEELTDLAGGTAPLLDRAEAHLAAGRALQALHFAEIVLSQAPKDTSALRVKLEAHELLLARSGRENFSEVRWLEAEIRDIREALS
ncbi:alkyl sulfatase dimerization domain-containing protein, partial [Pseudofrankia sp. BMG5.36]|uniref:alkyl sulfatase dimerization domain-containing protein n=1 Tax=Pseudofrankia sp. BMG5.36 TaxID=1834512 RepID=UPI000AA516C6